MDPVTEMRAVLTRRQFFGRCASGIGAAALSTLIGHPALGNTNITFK